MTHPLHTPPPSAQAADLQSLHQWCHCPTLPTQDANAGQAARLDDAAALLADKDRLEETVKKQHALIEQRGTEVKVLKAQLEGKEAALDKARCATYVVGQQPGCLQGVKAKVYHPCTHTCVCGDT